MATCALCTEHMPERDMADGLEVLLQHLRLFHPEQYGDGPDRWPDGAVVVDASEVAEPDDFG